MPISPVASVASQEHIDGMKAGSVVVDLAAETGGNIETTKCPGSGGERCHVETCVTQYTPVET